MQTPQLVQGPKPQAASGLHEVAALQGCASTNTVPEHRTVVCSAGGRAYRTRVDVPVPQVASQGDHRLQSDKGQPPPLGQAGAGEAQRRCAYTCNNEGHHNPKSQGDTGK